MRVGLLGTLEVVDGEQRLDVGGGRLQALLARLALDAGRPVTTAALVDAVWEDDPPAGELHALQSLVSRLRRALGDPARVEQTPAGYRLDAAADTDLFERLAAEGAAAVAAADHERGHRLLSEALALWRGDALAGLAARFAVEAAARLTDLRVAATADRVEAELALGRAGAATAAELERLAAEHPLDERIARQLLRVLAVAGRQADALGAYERLRARLDAELGAVPSAALQDAHLAVLNGAAAAPAAPRRRRTNLRAPLTTFVGRQDELDDLALALSEHRLVTLLGPGGAGKTRLSQEAAARWVDRMADGVWLVELAPVTDPAQVAHAVLTALDLREAAILEPTAPPVAGEALGRVLDLLADRTTLLVLDNCEHLIEAAAALAEEVLGRCPGVRIVATSREPLGIAGERLLDLPPLALPEPGAGPDDALAHPAVQLFADRAAAARPGFAVDSATVGPVVEICRRLDGLPLAIELAAARLRSLPPAEIARRLDDRFRLLTGGSRTAMPRHRTLRAVVDWSWELLDDAERALARRLAVFPAGATPDSAAAVCAGPDLPADAVLDLLAALVDRSLLQAVGDDGTPRYRMLETLREYGLEQLEQAGELEAVRTAHARHFAALVAELEPRLRTAGQVGPFHLLTAERENAAAALRHLVAAGDAGRALPLALSLLWYSMFTDTAGDAIGWLRLALTAEGEAEPGDRTLAEVLVAIADAEEQETADLELLAAYGARLEEVPDERWPIVALARPVFAWVGGDREEAERQIARAGELGDPWVRAAAPLILSQLAENDGDMAAVRRHVGAAVEAFRALGERWGLSMALLTRAGVLIVDGELDTAVAGLDEARRLTDELGIRARSMPLLDLHLADVQLRRGDPDGALRHLREAADRPEPTGEEGLILGAMRMKIAWLAGAHAQAHVLRGELETLLERPSRSAERGHARAMALAALGFLAAQEGDLERAGELTEAALTTAVATRDMPIVGLAGLASAQLAALGGAPAEAAERLGASARLRGSADPTNPEIAELTARLRGELGDAAFEAAYTRGREATRDGAIDVLRPHARRP